MDENEIDFLLKELDNENLRKFQKHYSLILMYIVPMP